MEALMAPSNLSNPRRAPAGGPWGVLLKMVNLHLGAVSAAPLQPLRTDAGVGWCHQAGTRDICEFRHPAWLMLQRGSTGKCRGPGADGSDRITTPCSCFRRGTTEGAFT